MSVAILVNVHSRHGSEALGARIRSIFPEAQVAVTRSLEDARAWIRDELRARMPELVLSGGGDGTAVALINELRDQGLRIPAFGLLPFGTGNGWARATGDVGTRAALRGLMALRRVGTPPLRRFHLVETEGRLTPFAGVGWDADILADYKRSLATAPPLVTRLGPTAGYLRSMFTRTIPRYLARTSRPRMRVVNLGPAALLVDPHGRAVPAPGGGTGAVLYDGPLGVCGAGTTEELGLGFRGFPFAHLVPGRMCLRVYAATAFGATVRMPRLWRGVHPQPDDHHFLVTRCRLEFDRAVPFEIGGDLAGERTQIEFELAADEVPLVDWRQMTRLVA